MNSYVFNMFTEHRELHKSILLWLMLAGAFGTVSRYWLAGFVQRICGVPFPFGTMAVNIIGCLLFGIIWSAMELRLSISTDIRIAVLTGFMGAFTTFSTVIFETGSLMRDGQWLLATANVAFQIVIGTICLFIGMAIGRLV